MRILLEDAFPFEPCRDQITESVDTKSGLKVRRVPGRLSVCDRVGGNRRRYPKSVWKKNLDEGSALKSAMARCSAFGLLEHPKDGQVDLRSPISHITVDARLVEGTDREGTPCTFVEGTLVIVDTPEGRKLSALIEAGYNPLVSSRGYGSLEKGADGVDVVQEDYICEGWDVVMFPSYEQAQLAPKRAESVEKPEEVPAPVVETAPAPVVEATKPLLAQPLSESVAQPKQTKQKTMDLTTIRGRLNEYKNSDPARLNAQGYVIGLSEMTEMHTQLARLMAEDATLSWVVQKLHSEISAIEEAWDKSFDAPRREVATLRENQDKLLQVVKGVAELALKHKTALSEARTASEKRTKLIESLAQRGRKFHQSASKFKVLAERHDKVADKACEVIDGLVSRYNADVTRLGRHVIESELGEKLTPAQKALLAKAKTPGAIASIRESIEKPEKQAKIEAKVPARSEKKPEKAPVTESTPPAVKDDVPDFIATTRRLSESRALQPA